MKSRELAPVNVGFIGISTRARLTTTLTTKGVDIGG